MNQKDWQQCQKIVNDMGILEETYYSLSYGESVSCCETAMRLINEDMKRICQKNNWMYIRIDDPNKGHFSYAFYENRNAPKPSVFLGTMYPACQKAEEKHFKLFKRS